MIAQHCDNRNTQPYQRIEQGMHFFRLAVIGEVAGDHQHISFIPYLDNGSRMRS